MTSAPFLSAQITHTSSLPLPPLLPLISTVNRECAVFPQALKESLTLHSHNHFRPGCLGRHLLWDVPAASQIRPLSEKKQKKKCSRETKKSETDRNTRACPVWKHPSWCLGGKRHSPSAARRGFGPLKYENDRL